MSKIRVDVHLIDKKHPLPVISKDTFEETSRKVAEGKFIYFSESGVTVNCSAISHIEYMYEVR